MQLIKSILIAQMTRAFGSNPPQVKKVIRTFVHESKILLSTISNVYFTTKNIYIARASFQKHGTPSIWPWLLKYTQSIQHEPEGWKWESPASQDIFCLKKNIDTFTRASVCESKMLLPVITFQMLTSLQKKIYAAWASIHKPGAANVWTS